MKFKKMRFQHGDLILVCCEKLPADVEEIKTPRENFIVEKGTGVHTHVIEKPIDLKTFTDSKGTLWLKIDSPNTITHEEHGPLVLPIGIYRKEIENEYDAEKDEAFKTKD
jgi:hypothetical protein